MSKRKRVLVVFLILMTSCASGQERIFSIGYAKNYITPDSNNYTIQLDFNRNPSKSEAAGTTWLLNKPLGDKFGAYIKPSVDVNIGSGTTTSPNNISIAIPSGIAFDVNNGNDIFSINGEIYPEIVSDKSLNNHLRYLTKGISLVYSHTSHSQQFVIDFSPGLYLAHGTRLRDIKQKIKNKYGRLMTPLFFNLSLLKSKDSSFYRIKLNTIYKFNNVFKDDGTLVPDKTLNYFYGRLDFYFIKNLAFSLVYNSGYEEPLFKKIKSLSFSITLAR